jgi:HPt (histidine-containing phosphotransfer) domain-containing protein
MIRLFIKQSTILISEIKQEFADNNWANFHSKIHKLMPSISFMGITELNKELQQIEETKTTPANMEMYAIVIEKLDLTLKQSCIELKQYLKEL